MPTATHHAEAAHRQNVHNLYRDHHGWLEAVLRRKLGNRDDAADLAQDTFERVMKTPGRDELREPRSYLSAIANNLMRNRFRRAALERAYLEALAARPELTAPSPETQRLLIEALEAVYAVLDGLPARTRRIFLMAQLEDMPYKDIAAQLQVSVNVVQKAVISGLQHCYMAVYA
ncbi:sigma-70 family RNA polymerase sigma factor [Bordetella petrii]|uniref:sigma-70 family RNA polymerase sigma factor n=1 Tax=Bordetella petrii TaxID=94624 RepID=UPI000491E080|nr:sigma-70 family RNA polymerase sigma factor [Bordetella petrii]